MIGGREDAARDRAADGGTAAPRELPVPREPSLLATLSPADAEAAQAEQRKGAKLDAVLAHWSARERADRPMRIGFAWALFGLLAVQLVAVNVYFVLMGAGTLDVEEWTSRTFFIGVFLEVAALARFVVRYLFSGSDATVLNVLKDLD